MQMVTTRAVPSSLSDASERMSGSCSPMSRNTAFSSRNAMVRQLVCSDIREAADCSTGDLWPSSRPVTTTASTPLAWIASAGR